MALSQKLRNWHIPLYHDNLILKEVYKHFKSMSAGQEKIPLIVQLIENPKYSLPGVTLFNGATDLKTHDYIHILLARGTLPKDEAFVLGFTMGSTSKVSTTEEKLYELCSKYLYPKVYQFSDEDIKVFKDGVRLGYISRCKALDTINYKELENFTLKEVREQIQLEKPLLSAYFEIEKANFPNSFESQRLL
jgi:hypothetical protein